jgi:hypothetical protein
MDLAVVPRHGDPEKVTRLERVTPCDCDCRTLCRFASVPYGLLKENLADEVGESHGEGSSSMAIRN